MKFGILIAAAVILSPLASAEQKEGCGTDTSLVSFKTDGSATNGNDYGLRNCPGGWVFANNAGEEAYIGKDNIPCVRNTTTKTSVCGPAINQTNTVDVNSPQKDVKHSKFVYKQEAGNKHKLFIIPLDDNGNPIQNQPQYIISGDKGIKDPNTGKTTSSMDVTQQELGKSKEGVMSVQREDSGTPPADTSACNIDLGKECKVTNLSERNIEWKKDKGLWDTDKDVAVVSDSTKDPTNVASTHKTVTTAQGSGQVAQ